MTQLFGIIYHWVQNQFVEVISVRRYIARRQLIASAVALSALFLFFSKGFCPIPMAKAFRWIFPVLLVAQLLQNLYKNQIRPPDKLNSIIRLFLLLLSIFYLYKISPRFYQTDPIGALFTGYFSWAFLLDRLALYLSIFISLHCVGILMSSSFWKENKLPPTLLSLFVGTAIAYFTVYAGLALHLKAFLMAKYLFLLALSISVLYEGKNLIKKRPELANKSQWLQNIPIVLYSFFIFAALDVFFGKIINPFHRDGDVWLHYLPYYLEVFNSQSWGPGELWYHFYCSKGAVLQFLTLYFSGGDIYSLRIIQYLFFLLSCFFLLNQLPKRSQKMIFSIAFMVVMLLIKASSVWGLFGKSHEVVFACIIVIMGSLAGLASMKNIKANCCLIISFSVMIGLLTPPLSLPLFCSLVTLSFLTSSELLRLKRTLQISAFFVAVQFMGQIAYNQWTTGLLMETPIRLAWALSNPHKIKEYFDPYLVQYLILGSSKNLGTIALSNFYSSLGTVFDLLKISDLIKLCGSAFFILLLFLAGYAYKALLLRGMKCSPSIRFLYIMILSTSIIGLLTGQTTSLGRILSFASLGISVFASTGLLFGLIKISFNKSSGIKLLPIALVFLAFSQFNINTDSSYASKISDVWNWLSGKTPSWGLALQINPAARSWIKLKNMLKPSDKIFCLSIISGPENVTQGNFVKSEVSHSFGPDWGKMVFGTPEQSQSVLDQYNIKYLAIEKYAFLFGAFPFSEYISSWIMAEGKTDIIYEDDFLFCLKTRTIKDIQIKMRDPAKAKNPPRFINQYIMDMQHPEYNPASAKMETLRNVLFQIWSANNGGVPIHLPAELPKDMGWQ